ncbi:hypothetical protein F4805DRAFT_313014 [Annulohypoxylon moriforme]|nr:hypothetical protein F4805DRAFT_313014 [Annulohypoxylon moriforme]
MEQGSRDGQRWTPRFDPSSRRHFPANVCLPLTCCCHCCGWQFPFFMLTLARRIKALALKSVKLPGCQAARCQCGICCGFVWLVHPRIPVYQVSVPICRDDLIGQNAEINQSHHIIHTRLLPYLSSCLGTLPGIYVHLTDYGLQRRRTTLKSSTWWAARFFLITVPSYAFPSCTVNPLSEKCL